MTEIKTNKKAKVVSTAKLKKENSLIRKENNKLKQENKLITEKEYDFKLTAEEIRELRELAASKLLDVETEISDNDIDLKIPTTMSIYLKEKKEFFERLFDKLNFNE